MDTQPKTFLEELQSLERPMKARVLIASTIVIMVVVLYFWVAYFNGIVSGGTQSAITDQDQQPAVAAAPVSNEAAEPSPQPGFWSRVSNGTAVVGDTIGGGFQWIGEMFEGPKNYMIQPGK